MSAKAIISRTWMLVWLSGGLAAATEPIRPAGMMRGEPAAQADGTPAVAPLIAVPTVPPPADAAAPAITQPPALPPGSVASPWTGCGGDCGSGGTGCCGPVGGSGPILSEFFFRTGVNFLVQGPFLKNTLQDGVIESFGGRSLFFNPAGSRAWTVEFGLDYFYNNGGKSTSEFPIDVVSPPNLPDQQTTLFANVREYHRVAVHFAGGREWYLYCPGYQPGTNFRFGWDVGGRYGYSRLNLNVFPVDPTVSNVIQFNHRSDTFGTVFISLHADWEFPVLDCKAFVVGVRSEWGYNFTDIAHLQPCDTQEVNLMLNFGLKY